MRRSHRSTRPRCGAAPGSTPRTGRRVRPASAVHRRSRSRRLANRTATVAAARSHATNTAATASIATTNAKPAVWIPAAVAITTPNAVDSRWAFRACGHRRPRTRRRRSGTSRIDWSRVLFEDQATTSTPTVAMSRYMNDLCSDHIRVTNGSWSPSTGRPRARPLRPRRGRVCADRSAPARIRCRASSKRR